MATIGSLSVSISATTKKFEKAMKKANKKIVKFSTSVQESALKVAKFGTALGGVALAGLTIMVKKQLDFIDATAKLSDRLGIATEDLQRLRFAAEITGAGTETLDKSFEQLSKRLGEASQGLGTGKDGLKALGLELNTLLGKNPAEQFKIIAEEVANLGTQEEKVAVATQLFGRSGVSLVNTLALGRKGIEELGRELDKLGGSFSRVDAARVEAANDAMHRLSVLFTSITQRVTIKLAPVIELITNRVIDFATEGEGLGKKLEPVFDIISNAIVHVINTFDQLKAVVLEVAAAMAFAFGKITFDSTLKEVAINLSNMADQAKWAFESGERGKAFANALDEIKKKSEEALKAAEKLNKETNKLSAAEKAAATAALKKRNELMKEGERLTKAMRTPAEKLNDEIEKLNKLIEVGAIKQEVFNRKFNELIKDHTANLPKPFEKMKEKIKEAFDAAKERLDDMKSRAAQIFEETRTPVEKIRKEMKELNELFNMKEAGLDESAFVRRMAELREKLSEALRDPLSGFAQGLIDEFKTPAQKLEERLAKIAEAFKRGLIDKDIFERASNAARKAFATAKPALSGTAKEVVLGRTSVKGLSNKRNKEVFDPQLKETNQILTRIERRGFGRRANVAVAQ